MILIGLLILGIGLGVALGVFVVARLLSSRGAGAAAEENLRLAEEAKRSAEAIRREAQVEAREEALKLRADVDRELQGKRAEIIKIEERVVTKEEEIDRKLTEFERRDQGLADREAHLKTMQDEIAKLEAVRAFALPAGDYARAATAVLLGHRDPPPDADLDWAPARTVPDLGRLLCQLRPGSTAADSLRSQRPS